MKRSFWTDYLWMTEEGRSYPELEEVIFSFPVNPNLVLQLEMDEEFDMISLIAASGKYQESEEGEESEESEESDGGDGGEEGVEIAWDDQAHPHPYALRLEELERISRAISEQPGFTGPKALPFLLLFRFAAVLPEQWDSFLTRLRGDFESLGIFRREQRELELLLEYIGRRKALVYCWEQSEHGWVLTGDDAYSLRNCDNDEFPFSLLETAGL